jgi:maltose O-acetyltransferase
VLSGRARLGALFQRVRALKYRALSDCRNVSGDPRCLQPVLLLGRGRISFGREVELGWPCSKSFHSGYCHLEATTAGSRIEIADGVQINNDAFIKSEGPGISIGRGALIGSEVTIYDSDFHDLRPGHRRGGRPRMAAVEIGEDVFIGDRVLVLKGVSIGRHSVIGAGSVVTGPVPELVIAAGNPARVIRSLSPEDDLGELREAARGLAGASLLR